MGRRNANRSYWRAAVQRRTFRSFVEMVLRRHESIYGCSHTVPSKQGAIFYFNLFFTKDKRQLSDNCQTFFFTERGYIHTPVVTPFAPPSTHPSTSRIFVHSR